MTKKIKDYASMINQNNLNFIVISNFRDYLTMLYQLKAWTGLIWLRIGTGGRQL
jgi:hypothetical protein